MKNSKFIVTDSGGMQEEATSPSISKSVLVLRRSTERPEALNARFAKLVMLEQETIAKEISIAWNSGSKRFLACPYGDGSASNKIVNVIRQSKIIPKC